MFGDCSEQPIIAAPSIATASRTTASSAIAGHRRRAVLTGLIICRPAHRRHLPQFANQITEHGQ